MTLTCPRGVRCVFHEAELEINFLAADMVRLTWGPGQLPVPVGPGPGPTFGPPDVTIDRRGTGATSRPGLGGRVEADGTVTYFDAAGGLLRQELPPLRRGGPALPGTASGPASGCRDSVSRPGRRPDRDHPPPVQPRSGWCVGTRPGPPLLRHPGPVGLHPTATCYAFSRIPTMPRFDGPCRQPVASLGQRRALVFWRHVASLPGGGPVATVVRPLQPASPVARPCRRAGRSATTNASGATRTRPRSERSPRAFGRGGAAQRGAPRHRLHGRLSGLQCRPGAFPDLWP